MPIGYEGLRIFKPARVIKLRVTTPNGTDVLFYDSGKESLLGSNEVELQTEKSSKMFSMKSVPIDKFSRELLVGIPVKEHHERVMTAFKGIETAEKSFTGTVLARLKIEISDNYFVCAQFKIQKSWMFLKPKDVGKIKTLFQGNFSQETKYKLLNAHSFDWNSAKLLNDKDEILL